MYKVKRWLPLVFFAGLAYVLYANWKLADTESIAHATACGRGGCPDVQPAHVAKDPFKHEYAWQVGEGTVDVTCRRGLILFGAWACKLDRERAAAVEGDENIRHYPSDTKRGSPD